MDDLLFSAILPPKKLGGKFSKAPESQTDGDLSVFLEEEEEHECGKCNFKSKKKIEVYNHKKAEHDVASAPIMIHSTGIFNTPENVVKS